MHFRSLLTVYLPAVEPDPEWEKEVADQVKQMRESQPEQLDSIGRKVMLDIFYEGMNNISTTFGREVTPVIRDVMERFNCGTEDKRFLEFDDRTGEALRDYNATVDCMRLPDGRIVEEYPAPQWHKFIIKDGKVYQREAGPLHHPKRTKAAKKISVVPNYPRKKLYGNSFERYIEEATYFTRNEETGKYGEWYNPDGVYDWYSIGGRWPSMFLVKNECTEYSLGERSAFPSDKGTLAPEGYRWVCCARKKDIQWDVMREWLNNRATDRYNKLKVMFETGVKDASIHGNEGNLIFVFGALGNKIGTFDYPVAIDTLDGKLFVLDRDKANLTIFSLTEFGCYVHEAVLLYSNGLYDKAIGPWQEVIKRDSNYELAYEGIGKAMLNMREYSKAMEYFKLANDRDGYSRAFKEYRIEWVRNHFTGMMIFLGLLIILVIIFCNRKRIWAGIKRRREGQ